MGRESFLVKVDWADDWPVFNDGRNITLSTTGRGAVDQAITQLNSGDTKWQADLSQKTLELGWYQKNTPLKNWYTLTERPGYIRLYGNCYDLASPEAPAMLLRKQSSYTESFAAKMQFTPRKAGYEAGIVVWWSQYSYATYGLTLRDRSNEESTLAMVSRVPSGKAGETTLRYADEPGADKIRPGDTIQLRVEATPTAYDLSFGIQGPRSVRRIPAKDLTVMPPIGGAFCGTM